MNMEKDITYEEPQVISPEIERAFLLRGYAALLHERFPINSSIENCSSEGSAYFWAMEKDNLEIPQDITFDAIKDSLCRTSTKKEFKKFGR